MNALILIILLVYVAGTSSQEWMVGDSTPIPIYIEPSTYPDKRVRHRGNALYNILLYTETGSGSGYEGDSSFNLLKYGDFWRFQSVNLPYQYIYQNGYRLKIGLLMGSAPSDLDDSMFKIGDALNGRYGYVSLESKNFPQHYLKQRGSEIWLESISYGTGTDWLNEASFALRCKTDTTCPVSHYKFLRPRDGGYLPMECYRDADYLNEWDSYHTNVNHQEWFIAGQDSFHDNDYRDRLFKWKYCRMTGTNGDTYMSKKTLARTGWDEHFKKSCSSENLGQAVMIGGESWHDNDKEDRVWDFHCGLLDSTKYTLPNCGWTGWVNDWDGPVNFECGNNGVIRGIESVHDNDKEDRLWKFECCNVALNELLSQPKGFWTGITNCLGCSSVTYQISVGIENSRTDSSTSQYTAEFSVTVEAGYEYAGASVSMSVSAGFAYTTSKTVEIAETYSMAETISVTCAKSHLYQWQMTANEHWNGANQEVKFKGNYYLCSNSASPRCAPGFCVDSECQSCTGGFTPHS